MSLDAFNALSEAEANRALAACLPVTRWVETVRDGRPYADWPALESTASNAAARLADGELDAALAGHPRIGERASSPDHQADFSEREQAGVDPADAEVSQALAEGNAAYEARFDRVFLIRAAGRSSGEILAELHRRLSNDDEAEREETVTQLREIALLRLRQVAS
jgi:2-oxo-4-hydroxy-4-carboxy-5-ureidoimidazoline decarboxylase